MPLPTSLCGSLAMKCAHFQAEDWRDCAIASGISSLNWVLGAVLSERLGSKHECLTAYRYPADHLFLSCAEKGRVVGHSCPARCEFAGSAGGISSRTGAQR